jgi:phospholipid/cholesterol/gamma-HCH transport system substrate-binding protein
VLALAACALTATGCGMPSLQGVMLPGGTSGPLHVTVHLADALDLVPQSAVKVADVTVGQVQSIGLDPRSQQAVVRLSLQKSAPVPANAVAVLRQTSLLGEKYVSLEAPAGQAPQGRIANGAVIPTSDSSDEAQAEDVLGALGDLLNGGGIAQLQTIAVEVSKVAAGREGQLRDLLAQLTTFVGHLDDHRNQIVAAIGSMDTLAKQLVAQKQTLVTALDDLAPGMAVVADERQDLTTLLGGLDTLGDTAKRVIGETQADTLHDLAAVTPTLQRLNAAGDDLVSSLQTLLTFPFGDNATKAIDGDYTNLYITLDLDLRQNVPGSLTSASSPLCGGLPVALPIPLPKPGFCLTSKASGATTTAPTSSGKAPQLTTPAPATAPASPAPGIIGSLLGGLLG